MNLLRFDSEGAWVAGVASLWRDRLQTNPRLRMCLPSGNTPIRLYAAMAESVKRGLVSFRKAEIFALDDYGGLAPDEEGKCVNVLRRFLIDHIDLPKEQFHFIATDAPDLERVCRDYDRLIGDGLATFLGHPTFRDVPAVLETWPEEGLTTKDIDELRRLHRLGKRRAAARSKRSLQSD